MAPNPFNYLALFPDQSTFRQAGNFQVEHLNNPSLVAYVRSEDDPINASIVQPNQQWQGRSAGQVGPKRQPLPNGRVPPALSESGTLPDSAYGTASAGLRPSLGHPSLCGDSAETKSCFAALQTGPVLRSDVHQQYSNSLAINSYNQWARRMGENQRQSVSGDFDMTDSRAALNLNGLNSSLKNFGSSTSNRNRNRETSSREADKKIPCNRCDHLSKTQSEHKKHYNRHILPHKCDVPDCKNTKGFATSNDLERHKKSVHQETSLSDSGFYLCPFGNCSTKQKKWPRCDNFRQHVRSVHNRAVTDASSYLVKPPPAHQIDLAGLSSADGGFSASSQFQMVPPAVPWEASMLGGFEDIGNQAISSQQWPADFEAALASLSGGVANVSPREQPPTMTQDHGHVAKIATVAIDQEATMPSGNKMAALQPRSWRVQATSGSQQSSSRTALPISSKRMAAAAIAQPRSDALSATVNYTLHPPRKLASSDATMPNPKPLVMSASPVLVRGIHTRESTSIEEVVSLSSIPATPGNKSAVPEAPIVQHQPAENTDCQEDESEKEDNDSECGAVDVPTGMMESEGDAENEAESGDDADNDRDDEDEDEEPLETTTLEPEKRVVQSVEGPKSSASLSTGEDIDVEVLTDGQLSGVVKKLQKTGRLSKLLEELGFQRAPPEAMPTESSGSLSSEMKTEPTENTTKKYICNFEGCSKRFSANTTLTKHKRRHQRPFGCTFPNCDKKLGSKNDWKRHESSQHIQMECWQCKEKCGSGRVACKKTFSTSSLFEKHLADDHSIADTERVEKARSCRFGYNYEPRFWCGFCDRIIVVPEAAKATKDGRDTNGDGNHDDNGIGADRNGDDSVNSSSSSSSSSNNNTTSYDSKTARIISHRFDHIDDHFMGRNGSAKDISMWVVGSELNLTPVHSPANSDDAQPSTRKRRRKETPFMIKSGRPTKKRDQKTATIWYCCQCNNYYDVGINDTSCMLCGHYRCDHCEEE